MEGLGNHLVTTFEWKLQPLIVKLCFLAINNN